MSKYLLFIDETGMGDPKSYSRSPYYILVGCIIKADKQEKIRKLADQIKYKYWSKTNIVFHSSEIGAKIQDFKILTNPDINKEFLKDLKKLLSLPEIKFIYSLTDKEKAHRNSWTSKTIYKRSSKSIIQTFLSIMSAQKSQGEIICEYSTAEKDLKLYEAFAHYLSRGIPTLKIDHQEAKDRLTSIKFATKRNFDTETQLCDLLGHIAKYSQLQKSNKLNQETDYSYEEYMLSVFKNNMFTVPTNANLKKANIYKKVKNYTIMP